MVLAKWGVGGGKAVVGERRTEMGKRRAVMNNNVVGIWCVSIKVLCDGQVWTPLVAPKFLGGHACIPFTNTKCSSLKIYKMQASCQKES
jgi:hypothetical protein